MPWLDDNPQLVLRHIQSWDRRRELGDGTSRQQYDTNDILRAQTKLKTLISGGHLTVYRAMTLTPTALRSLEPGDGLGQSWSSSLDTAVVYNASVRNLSHHVVFAAEVAVGAVDWLATIALADSGENEVRLNYLAPVTVLWIKGHDGGALRKDLWHALFHASGAI